MHQPRHAEIGVAAEDHRVQPLVGDTRVNDLHFLQAGNGFEIDRIVQHQQVAALHERDTHAAREEAVLGVHRAAGAGGEEYDGGIRVV